MRHHHRMREGGTSNSPRHTGDTDPTCELRNILDRIADKWSLLVICVLADGVRRFSELRPTSTWSANACSPSRAPTRTRRSRHAHRVRRRSTSRRLPAHRARLHPARHPPSLSLGPVNTATKSPTRALHTTPALSSSSARHRPSVGRRGTLVASGRRGYGAAIVGKWCASSARAASSRRTCADPMLSARWSRVLVPGISRTLGARSSNQARAT